MYQNEYTERNRHRHRHSGSAKLQLAAVMFGASVVLLIVSLFIAVTALGSGGDGGQPVPVLRQPMGSDQEQGALPQSAQFQPTPAPALSTDDWRLRLVNPWNSLPEDYSIETVTLGSGERVDARCYPDLQAMMDACRAAGNSPVICSGYRTWDTQNELFQNQVDGLLAQGYSQEEAKKEAGTAVAVPGTSEHQLGLAVDIVDVNNQNLDESQEGTEVQKWLMEHSWEYGFILRYPNEKSEITGIIYEPWHYRYVGRDDAGKIHSQGVCLEEYLQGGN